MTLVRKKENGHTHNSEVRNCVKKNADTRVALKTVQHYRYLARIPSMPVQKAICASSLNSPNPEFEFVSGTATMSYIMTHL